MSDTEKQFRRVERSFERVLHSQNCDQVDYEDDVWCFIHNCWHLKDWMAADVKGLQKKTRARVDSDVHSFWKLVLIGDLANRSRHLRLNDRESDEDIRSRELRLVSKVHRENGEGNEEVVLIVTDDKKLEYPVRELAKDAMRIWHNIFKAYGLGHLLKKS